LEGANDTYSARLQTTPAPNWSCINRNPVGPPDNVPPMVPYTVPVIDWVTNETPAGLNVTVCNRLQPNCENPLASYDKEYIKNHTIGRDVTFPLPTDVNVFLIFKAEQPQNPLDNEIPLRFYFDGLVEPGMKAGILRLIKFSVVVGIATQLKAGTVDF